MGDAAADVNSDEFFKASLCLPDAPSPASHARYVPPPFNL
jgi:hypothetical protein